MRALDFTDFAVGIQRASPEPLADACIRALHTHYRLLLRWNETISLVGRGTLGTAITQHYGDSLAALALMPDAPGRVLADIGSGAGFPGFVLAAARPRLRYVLVEPRERKWAFLKQCVAATSVAAECLLASVGRTLPAEFPARVDWLTLRALKLPDRAWRALASRLTDDGRVLVWAGREDPALPAGLFRIERSLSLPGAQFKRILELERARIP